MQLLKIRDPKRNFIMSSIDLIVGLPFRLINILKHKCNTDLTTTKISKILLLRTDNIGDVLLLTPTIKSIKKKYPMAELDVLVRPSVVDILAHNPDVTRVIASRVPWFMAKHSIRDYIHLFRDIINIRKARYDLIIDFRGDFRNIFFYLYFGNGKYRISSNRSGGGYLLTHVVDFNEDCHAIEKNNSLLYPLGIFSHNRTMSMTVVEEDRTALQAKVGQSLLNNNIIIGIHPGASSLTRRWSLDKFADVILEISSQFPCTIFVSGDHSEKSLGAELRRLVGPSTNMLDLTGLLSLKELAALLEKTSLFICNETGIMHLAIALNIKTISLFGPQLPRKYGHENGNSQILWKEFDCCPCLHHLACKKSGTTLALCLDSITSKDVMDLATVLLMQPENK